MTTLVTVAEERDVPGAVPTVPVGRRLAERLVDAGEPVRVLAPATAADGWPAEAEVVVGDVARPAETPNAFAGLTRMFLAGAVPQTVRPLVSLAEDGGVERVAVLSSHGPEFEIEYEPEAWYWLAVEVVVERSRAAWTHLRPGVVMAQTLSPGFHQPGPSWVDIIRADRTVHAPHVDARYPLIDEDDLAAVAATVLLEERYTGRTLNVYGEALSTREQLDLISSAIGRPVDLHELSPEEARELYRAEGMSEEEIDLELGAGEDFLAEPWQPDPTVSQVLGRPPRGFADWLAEHADAFR